ncbi:MAG: NAD(+) diphosphatase [Nocardiopsaceae bacterium]|nr:NAD(+) diphosphatase [Nocardiopsaceae bacterium]
MAGSLISVSGGIALTRHEVERCTDLRTDEDWLAKAWDDPRTRVLVIDKGQALARLDEGSAELMFVSPEQAPEGARFLLGVDFDDVAYFGVGGPIADAPAVEYSAAATARAGDGAARLRRAGLREAGTLLTDRDAGLMTHAVALANWHAVAAFCSRCGAPTEPAMAGHSRKCTVDGSEHFPRCDPAVIMLVTDPDDRCLLARNTDWPERRVSVLAGFVEPGESAEQAVAREVHEETGVTVSTVTYAASQPWPMPHNLMLGFTASATDTVITVDGVEIAEATWDSRADLRAALLSGDLIMPPSLSISRWLIETWYGTDLPRPAKQTRAG